MTEEDWESAGPETWMFEFTKLPTGRSTVDRITSVITATNDVELVKETLLVERYASVQVLSPEAAEDDSLARSIARYLERGIYQTLFRDGRRFLVGEPRFNIYDASTSYPVRGPWWRRPLERLGLLDRRMHVQKLVGFRMEVKAA